MKLSLYFIALCSFFCIKAQKWEWLSHAPTVGYNISNYLTDIYFVDADKGFLVGLDGTLFCTKNGGDTWDSIKTIVNNSSTTQNFHQISFTDSLNGLWFTENSINIFNTSNGGVNWLIPNFFMLRKLSFNSIVSNMGKFYVAAVDTLGASHLFILGRDLTLKHHIVGDTVPTYSYNEVFLTKQGEILYLQYQKNGTTKLFGLDADSTLHYITSFPGRFLASALQKNDSNLFLCNCFNSFETNFYYQNSSSGFTLNLQTNLLRVHTGSMLQSFQTSYFVNENIGWRSTFNGLEETIDGGRTFIMKEPDVFIAAFKEDKRGWLYGVGKSVYKINLNAISAVSDIKKPFAKLLYNVENKTISLVNNDSKEDNISLKIFDGMGRIIMNDLIEKLETLKHGFDVSILNNGFYVAHVSNQSFSLTTKIIIQ